MDKTFGKRKSIRIREFDYSSDGYYFITICIDRKRLLFGKIINKAVQLNSAGIAAQRCWIEIPAHYPNVKLDMFVVMPNHVHGILIIENDREARAQNIVPLRNRFQGTLSGSVGAIVRGYKIGVGKWFRQNTYVKEAWQKNYYEHIIRKEESLFKIQEYILNNPASWEKDEMFHEDGPVH